MLRVLTGLMIVSGLVGGATDPDPLPRRGFFGAALAPVVRVAKVVSGAMAAAGAEATPWASRI